MNRECIEDALTYIDGDADVYDGWGLVDVVPNLEDVFRAHLAMYDIIESGWSLLLLRDGASYAAYGRRGSPEFRELVAGGGTPDEAIRTLLMMIQRPYDPLEQEVDCSDPNSRAGS